MLSDAEFTNPGGWTVVKRVRNPWGQVPLTAGGQSLSGHAQRYMDELMSHADSVDPDSRRHHYVPKTYLKHWSFDGRRVWTLDTKTGLAKPLGLRDVCVEENFNRVVGPDGEPHNRVELIFGVVDKELARVQSLLIGLEDPNALEFDDLIGLGVTVSVQRNRTLQQRRLRLQHNHWLHVQNPDDFVSIENTEDEPFRLAGIHTELLFKSIWNAADVMTTRHIEIWDDPQGRFMTSDAPVIVPFKRNQRTDLISTPYVIWPISPFRTVALTNEPTGEKATILLATGKHLGMVREGVEQGRERLIFASEAQSGRLPTGKKFRRRVQSRVRCSQYKPSGEYIPPPGCCTAWHDTFADKPDIVLCNQGLHEPVPDIDKYA